MYIPNFKRNKGYINTVKKYDDSKLQKVIFSYICEGKTAQEISNTVLKTNSGGYDTLEILEYYGVRRHHYKLFSDFKIDELYTILESESNASTELLTLINGYIEKFFNDLDEIKIDEIDKDDLDRTIRMLGIELSNDLDEAYLNQELKVRNPKIQQKLRKELLKEFGTKCAICNIDIADLLIASHIIPYSRCDSKVEIVSDPNNALLLCANHDKLFESSNHISFNNKGEIVIEDSIKDNELYQYNLSKQIQLESRILSITRREYLKLHCEIFEVKHRK